MTVTGGFAHTRRAPRGTDVLSVVSTLLLVRRRCIDLLMVCTCLCRG